MNELNFKLAASAVNLKPLLSAASDREINLIVALVVFIVLSVLLTAFVILLFANKKFRAFFFRTSDEESKTGRKRSRSRKNKSSADGKTRRAPVSRIRQKREQAAADYLDEVPTVPLGGFSTVEDEPDVMRRTADAYINMSVSNVKRSASKKRDDTSDSLDKIPTVVIPQSTVDNIRTAQQASAHPVKPITTDKPATASTKKANAADNAKGAKPTANDKAVNAAGKKANAADNAKGAKPTANDKAVNASGKKANAADNAKVAKSDKATKGAKK